jgi:hypothetical protein
MRHARVVGSILVVLVTATLGITGVATTSHAAPRRTKARVSSDRLEDEFAAYADAARLEIEARLGHPLGLPITVKHVDHIDGGIARADLVDASGDPVTSGAGAQCVINVTTPPASVSELRRRGVAAHEVFHCFQGDLVGARIHDIDRWIVEGQAEWVSLTVVPRPAARDWNEWLDSYQTPLYERAYDAVGFYSVVAQSGIDPWTILEPTLRAASNDDALSVATNGEGAPFVSRIAMAVSRIPELGPAWESSGPGVIADTRSTRSFDVAPGSPVRARDTLAAHSARGYELDARGDVLRVRSNAPFGAVGFVGTSAERFAGPYDATFCLRASCTCPGGGAPSGPQLGSGATGTVGVAVGASGSQVDVTTRVEATSMRDYCRAHRPSARCFPGTFKLTAQTLAPEISANLGGLTLSGGIGGRSIELRADGHYVVHDDGSDPVTISGTVAGAADVNGTAAISADADGTYAVTGNTITFTNENFTLHDASFSINVAGVTVNQPIPASALQDVYGWSGDSTWSCAGNTLTLQFPNATFTLDKT